MHESLVPVDTNEQPIKAMPPRSMIPGRILHAHFKRMFDAARAYTPPSGGLPRQFYKRYGNLRPDKQRPFQANVRTTVHPGTLGGIGSSVSTTKEDMQYNFIEDQSMDTTYPGTDVIWSDRRGIENELTSLHVQHPTSWPVHRRHTR